MFLIFFKVIIIMDQFEKLGYKLGYIKDRYDHRDHMHMLPMVLPKMPSKFDLKDKVKTIFKQKYNDCSANVISNVVSVSRFYYR